jgi:hypothetical protein
MTLQETSPNHQKRPVQQMSFEIEIDTSTFTCINFNMNFSLQFLKSKDRISVRISIIDNKSLVSEINLATFMS